MTKFTFKTIKHRNRLASTTHQIKLNKDIVGTIKNEKPHKITLKTVHPDFPDQFQHVVLSPDFSNLQEAKNYLLENAEYIQNNIHFFRLSKTLKFFVSNDLQQTFSDSYFKITEKFKSIHKKIDSVFLEFNPNQTEQYTISVYFVNTKKDCLEHYKLQNRNLNVIANEIAEISKKY